MVRWIAFAFAAGALPSVAAAQITLAVPGQPEARTAVELMPGPAPLEVRSAGFKEGELIPFQYTAYRGNTFPGLSWSPGPERTRSYAIIMQDNTAILRGAPILHWTMFNIPPTVRELPAGMPPDGMPAGALYGPNIRGMAQPYAGPRTPPGPAHSYHFEVFALDVSVDAAASTDYSVLAGAMAGHVLASGEIVGKGVVDPTAPPPASGGGR